MSDNKFKNFAVLTLAIQSVEVKESKKGGQYAIAQALLQPGEGERPETKPMPFRVIVNNGLTKVLKAGTTMTLVGHLGYEEKDSGDKEHRTAIYLFFPYKFEETKQPRSFAQLTLRAGQEATSRYTDSGVFWAHTRMALGMGKDEKEEYKPSLWLNVKAFSRDGDQTLVQKLTAVAKGSLVTVSGRLTYEAYTDKDGVERVSTGLVVSKISDFEGGGSQTEGEESAKEFVEPSFG